MRTLTFATALAIFGLVAASADAQQAPRGSQAQPQGQDLSYCLDGGDGEKNCGFATMAQCQEARKGVAEGSTCTPNVRASTTGSGSGARGNTGAQ